MYDQITSEKRKEIVINGWKAAGILYAAEMGSTKLKCLDPFNDIGIHSEGILSASKMIFSSPKKVTRMLINDTNQIQKMNMFCMTKEVLSMQLLFRSSSILKNFLRHLFCFTLFVRGYS